MAGQIVYGHRVTRGKVKQDDLNSPSKISLNQFMALTDRFSRQAFHEFNQNLNYHNKYLKFTPQKLFLTFDDGYRDFKDIIFPVLEEHGIHCILFITTGFIEKTCFPYEHLLSDLIEQIDTIKTQSYGTLKIDTYKKKQQAYNQLRISQKYNDYSERHNFIKNIYEINGRKLFKNQEPLFASWDDILEVSESPLITIGSHTCSHVHLPNCPVREVWFELSESKKIIEKKLKKKIAHFSFPYGGYNLMGCLLAMFAGYRFAFSTSSSPMGKIRLLRMALPRTDIKDFT